MAYVEYVENVEYVECNRYIVCHEISVKRFGLSLFLMSEKVSFIDQSLRSLYALQSRVWYSIHNNKSFKFTESAHHYYDSTNLRSKRPLGLEDSIISI